MKIKKIKDKIIGRWEQFSKSDLGIRIIKRTKSWIWRYGIFLAISSIAYFVNYILPNSKFSPEIVTFIAYICNEITKDLNRKKDENNL